MNKSPRVPARSAVLLSTFLVLLLNVPSAIAQSSEFNHFGVSLGAFVTERNSKVQLNGSIPDSGTPVDLESDLGLESSSSVFRLDGHYRFNEKHRLDFSVFDLSRSSSKQIQIEIDWDDVVYPIDTVLSTNFDLKIYKLAYTWSFMQGEKGYLGVTGGLYVADIGTRLAAESIGERSGNGLTAILPVVGVRGQYDFTDKWSLRGSTEFFALEYGDYDGSLFDIYGGVHYRIRDGIAVGLGFNTVRLSVGVSKPRFNGDLNWRYTGGLLSMSFDF